MSDLAAVPVEAPSRRRKKRVAKRGAKGWGLDQLRPSYTLKFGQFTPDWYLCQQEAFAAAMEANPSERPT
jgi:hypothetical protein